MKVKAISLVESPGIEVTGTYSDVIPDTVTVELTLAEVTAIASMCGSVSGYGQRVLGGATSDIYQALTGDVLNRFFDGGLDDARSFFGMVKPDLRSLDQQGRQVAVAS